MELPKFCGRVKLGVVPNIHRTNLPPTAPFGVGYTDRFLQDEETREVTSQLLESIALDGKKILLIVPDGTRTAPVGPMFHLIHELIDGRAEIDVIIALGTHQPMTDAEINARLDLTPEDRAGRFAGVKFFNHAWDDETELHTVGTIPAADIEELSKGLFSMDVPVAINKRVLDYDLLLVLGPVFPHEVAGFSGGNKYLFPGIAGPEVLNFFHWLGAVVTNPKIIGHKWTPVRAVIDRAASMVPVEKACLCMVVNKAELSGLYGGNPVEAWDAASDLSAQLHIIKTLKPFHTVLSCSPTMYKDLWTGGKCMYKLEPVVADGGELIIYAPHITEISETHAEHIEKIGYHTRDYFLNQWEQFKDEPWGVIAHSTHVRGIGTWEDGQEKPRVRVTLATGISEEMCHQISMGYRDPATIDVESFANREDEGVLLVRKAGEMLYQLEDAPEWASEG